MGLDMYLKGKKFLWTDERKKLKVSGVKLPKGVEISGIEFNVGYWRKANAIHNWFVENVQKYDDDCGTLRDGRSVEKIKGKWYLTE